MKEGKLRPSAGTEISAEAELETCEKAVPHIAPEILPAKANDLRAICSGKIRKKRNDRFRNELNPHSDHQTDRCGKQYGTAKGFYSPLRLTGSDILRAKSRNCGKHGGRD